MHMLTQHRVNSGLGNSLDGMIFSFTYMAIGIALIQWIYP